MKNIWFTADLHLGHRKVALEIGRPWKTIPEHDEAIIARWNLMVKPGDTTYLLGDFAMPQKVPGVDSMKLYRKYLNALNGKKILIKGNHDHMSQDMYKQFTEVHDMREIKIDGQYWFLCHYPMRSWNRSFYGVPHLFGHVHGRVPDRIDSMSTDVGVDVKEANYSPFPYDYLKEKMSKKYVLWREYWDKRNKDWKL